MKFAAALLLTPALAGCYLFRQAAGQLDILVGQEPIAKVVESDRLTGEEARKLLLVEEAREFAFGTMHLVRSDNYTTFYDTRGKPVSWLVSACRRDRFESYVWSFPIVGSFPYKGFFRRKDASAEARELEEAGYDTAVREVAGYSTLGWFRDPVFSSMLRRSEADLVALILHELTHDTIHAPDAADFNEAMASFVGLQGALEFLERRYGPSSRELLSARQQFHDDELFDEFIRVLYDRLDAIYRLPSSSEEKIRRRNEVFEGSRREFVRLKPRFRTPSYLSFDRAPLNNAEIVAHRRYGGYPVFRRIFESVRGSWVAFFSIMRAAAASPDPLKTCEHYAAPR